MSFIFQSVFEIVREIFLLFHSMSAYLLLGFALAGFLKLLLPEKKLQAWLSRDNLASVVKAALIGAPLPICSCGVIPLSAHLRQSGVGRAATVSFLGSTPTSGVDSFFATYSMLGLPFALIRLMSSFIVGIFAGILSLIFNKEKQSPPIVFQGRLNQSGNESHSSVLAKIRGALQYGFFDLIGSVSKWILLGVTLGGVIAWALPPSFIEQFLGSLWLSYLIMLVIGTPIYVCSIGAIPIATALVMKGLSPGAALIFLIAGPATSMATIAFLWGQLGFKSLFLYILAIIIVSLGFGVGLDYGGAYFGYNATHMHTDLLPFYWNLFFTVVLGGLMFWNMIQTIFLRKRVSSEFNDGHKVMVIVPDMTCSQCQAKLEGAFSKNSQIKAARFNLEKKTIEIESELSASTIHDLIKAAGYSPQSKI